VHRLEPVALQSADANELIITWKPPPEELMKMTVAASSSEVTYELQIREESAPKWSTIGSGLKATMARKKQLDAEGSYFFRIKPIFTASSTSSSSSSPNEEREKKKGGDISWTYSSANAVGFKPIAPVKPCHPKIRALLGDSIIAAPHSGGQLESIDKLAGSVVGVYFSGSWW
jgi:hypothetical protein